MVKLIDLYHITSHPMWYDEASRTLYKDAKAATVTKATRIGFRKFEEAARVEVCPGYVVAAYGIIYECQIK